MRSAEWNSLEGLRENFKVSFFLFTMPLLETYPKSKEQSNPSWSFCTLVCWSTRKQSDFFLPFLRSWIPPPLPRCLPRVGAPLLDFTGCFASGLPGFLAAGQCSLQTGRYLRIPARKPQLARCLNITRVWDRLYHTVTLLWSWRRTPAPKKRLLRSWPCGPVWFENHNSYLLL